jgi:hypothetical protein
MSDPIVMPPYYDDVLALLQLFYPQYFDPDSPDYIDTDILDQLFLLSVEARPWCLGIPQQNLAQAMFMAYLISLRSSTSSGQAPVAVAGPIVSEKEGDISVTYADLSQSSGSDSSNKPPGDPWDQWNRLYKICGRGAILTRYGDPCPSSIQTKGSDVLSLTLARYARGVWRPVY